MAAALLPSAVFAALLLPLTGAGADLVSWGKCNYLPKHLFYYDRRRVRLLEALPDGNATEMWLQFCSLVEVRSGYFDGIPNVVTIMLDNNSIARVDPAAFRTVPKLRRLYLQNNNLREVPVFDEHSFCPSLTNLYLRHNKITEINHPKTFSGCTELQNLDISTNYIGYIHPDIFRPLSKLEALDLRNNKITAIPETLFIKNNKLNFLDLVDNKIPYLPFDFVSKLRSAGVPFKQFYFHGNPWHCGCLLEVLAEVKRAGVMHVSTYIGTAPVCMYDGPYPCRPVPTGLLRRAAPGGGH